VQEDAVHLAGGGAGVLLLAEERVTAEGKLDPDLILHPGLQNHLQQGARRMSLHHEPMQDRLLSLSDRHRIHAEVALVLSQVMLEPSLVPGRDSVHGRHVATLGRPLAKLRPEHLRARAIPGKDEQARDVPVQAMDRMDEAPLFPEGVEQAGVRRALGALHQHARALVDHQVVLARVKHPVPGLTPAIGANACALRHGSACPTDGIRGRGLMDPDLPLVVTGAGLSGCIGRWFVDEWPGRARFVGPAHFLRPHTAPSTQLLVLSQSGSPHGRMAIRAGGSYLRCFVCGAVDPRPLCPDGEWLRTSQATEEGLRVEGPLAQIAVLQALLPSRPEAELPCPDPLPGTAPLALLHDGRPRSRLFAELTAWTLLEHLGPPAARSFEVLDFAHGGLQALPAAPTGPLWLWGQLEDSVRTLVANAVAPHRLHPVGAGPDAWRTVIQRMAAWPRRRPFGPDGALYGLDRPPSPPGS